MNGLFFCIQFCFLERLFIAYNYKNAQFVLLSSPRHVCHKNPDDFSSYCISVFQLDFFIAKAKVKRPEARYLCHQHDQDIGGAKE